MRRAYEDCARKLEELRTSGVITSSAFDGFIEAMRFGHEPALNLTLAAIAKLLDVEMCVMDNVRCPRDMVQGGPLLRARTVQPGPLLWSKLRPPPLVDDLGVVNEAGTKRKVFLLQSRKYYTVLQDMTYPLVINMVSKSMAATFMKKWSTAEAANRHDAAKMLKNAASGASALARHEGDAICLVAREGGPRRRVLAALTAIIMPSRRVIELQFLQLYVCKEARNGRQGPHLGQALLWEGTQIARARGATQATVGVGLADEKATATFWMEIAGFERPSGWRDSSSLSELGLVPMSFSSTSTQCRLQKLQCILELHITTEAEAAMLPASYGRKHLNMRALKPGVDEVDDDDDDDAGGKAAGGGHHRHGGGGGGGGGDGGGGGGGHDGGGGAAGGAGGDGGGGGDGGRAGGGGSGSTGAMSVDSSGANSSRGGQGQGGSPLRRKRKANGWSKKKKSAKVCCVVCP